MKTPLVLVLLLVLDFTIAAAEAKKAAPAPVLPKTVFKAGFAERDISPDIGPAAFEAGSGVLP